MKLSERHTGFPLELDEDTYALIVRTYQRVFQIKMAYWIIGTAGVMILWYLGYTPLWVIPIIAILFMTLNFILSQKTLARLSRKTGLATHDVYGIHLGYLRGNVEGTREQLYGDPPDDYETLMALYKHLMGKGDIQSAAKGGLDYPNRARKREPSDIELGIAYNKIANILRKTKQLKQCGFFAEMAGRYFLPKVSTQINENLDSSYEFEDTAKYEPYERYIKENDELFESIDAQLEDDDSDDISELASAIWDKRLSLMDGLKVIAKW